MAGVSAGVCGDHIAIVALLAGLGIDAAVTAALNQTGRRTGIAADAVAIVAFLALAGNAVTATSRCATVGAIVGLDAVAVVAGFASIDASITADFAGAIKL